MAKKNAAIVLGATKNYFHAVGTLVLNIQKTCPGLADDIFIFHDMAEERDREILEGPLACTLRPFPYRLKAENERFSRFSMVAFSLYEIFSLLDEYRNVLWLDGDICVLGDLSGILAYGPVAMRRGVASFQKALGRPVSPEVDNVPTYNTGVVLATDKLKNYQQLREDCYRYTKEFQNTLYLPDQGIFNYVLWKNGIPVTDLPNKFNFTNGLSMHEFQQALLIHTAGDVFKLWNYPPLRKMFPLWAACQAEWLSMGGSAFAGDQLIPDTGEIFTLQNVLADSLGLYGIRSLCQTQEEYIAKLENSLKELTAEVTALTRKR
ncbi:hypothetical protein LJC26_05745 [Desulfovibrio sp. OttesenSCG-928-O18]|nr:hypothetical protein [Desulfovibrio sp. OttesenSCG-928-O18]